MAWTQIDSDICKAWQTDTLDALKRFVEIPSKSAGFDPEWIKNGYLHKACEIAKIWGERHFPKARFEILRINELTPVLFFDIPATQGHDGDAILFYGHFDKQPESSGWSEGLAPWTPIVKNERLYGRGAADDGYSFYTALTTLSALERSKIAHPRCVGMIETDEETGSHGFEEYLALIQKKVENVGLIIVLDASNADTKRLWQTASFRGALTMKLQVRVLDTAVHSGVGSGVVPSSFSVLRQLLDRIEDPVTGKILLPELYGKISDQKNQAMKRTADILGNQLFKEFDWADNTQPLLSVPLELIKRRSWEPTLSVIGIEGVPAPQHASNLVHTHTTLILSIRLPPDVDANQAFNALKTKLSINPPQNASIDCLPLSCVNGFNTPEPPDWLEKTWNDASRHLFEKDAETIFEGGTIGILNEFSRTFKNPSFLMTGVLGPGTNAHASDEYLDLAYVNKLTCAIARVIAASPQKGGVHHA